MTALVALATDTATAPGTGTADSVRTLDLRPPCPAVWLLDQLDRESHLALRIIKRLGKCDAFQGLTTPEERVLRFRRCILDGGIADAVAGKRGGASLTFRELFEVVLGEPLKPPAATKRITARLSSNLDPRAKFCSPDTDPTVPTSGIIGKPT